MLNWVLAIISSALLMTGNCSGPGPAPCQVVTAVTVRWQEDEAAHIRRYTGQGEMNKVLNYLRSLDPAELPGPPQETGGPVYDICLRLSDGSAVRYTQQSLFYLREDDGPWLEIDPEEAIRLPLILAAIAGDGG